MSWIARSCVSMIFGAIFTTLCRASLCRVEQLAKQDATLPERMDCAADLPELGRTVWALARPLRK